jgi:hypothetical protein
MAASVAMTGGDGPRVCRRGPPQGRPGDGCAMGTTYQKFFAELFYKKATALLSFAF